MTAEAGRVGKILGTSDGRTLRQTRVAASPASFRKSLRMHGPLSSGGPIDKRAAQCAARSIFNPRAYAAVSLNGKQT